MSELGSMHSSSFLSNIMTKSCKTFKSVVDKVHFDDSEKDLKTQEGNGV